MTRFLLRDRLSWLVLVAGAACLVPTVLRIGSPERIHWFNANLSDPIMVGALLIVVFTGLRRVHHSIEKRFWVFWGLGFVLLLAAHLLRLALGTGPGTSAGFAGRCLLLVGFYVLAALALERRPHISSDARGRIGWMDRLETAGVLTLGLGLYVYFVIVPITITPDPSQSSVRMTLLLLGFDLYLGLRLLDSFHTSTERRWRATYALLLAATVVWLAADISILLGLLQVVGYETFQNALDWLWLPPYLGFAAAVRLRDWKAPVSDEDADDEISTDQLRSLTIETARSTLWFHAGLLPVLHVILETAGFLDSRAQLSQQGCALAVLLINGILAVAYQRRLESANVSLASERARAEEAVRQAYHDPLTGLPNRYLLLDHLRLGVAQARREGRIVAVLFIDIDRFKTINDSLGHSAGDQLLVQIAERFTYCLRSTDTLARLGGDEFIVVAPGLHERQDVMLVANKLTDSLRAPFTLESTELFITASIGVAIFPESDADDDAILRDADIAMYRAKAQGGGVIEIYDAEKFGEAVSRLSMETMLRRAVFDEAFVLHFQPVVDLAQGGCVIGCEALIRWVHPERGLLPPGEFLELAENSGVTSRLTPWLLEESCLWAARWQRAKQLPLRIAINLSARQFLDQRFKQYVEAALEKSGIDGETLELEVTESVAMQSVERMIQTLAGLKTLGVRVAIDDFGTGYSSLYALRTLPIDTLKIDKSFVAGIATNHSDAAITSTILAVANTLGLAVVAEGVETADQLEMLERLGCNLMQGYLFSPPIPPEGIPDLLGESLLPRAPVS
jgi:diguanylate cyclase (GGDEF)-like protein